MKRLKSDVILLIGLCLVSIFLYYKSLAFPKGAEIYPRVLIVLILVLSIGQIIFSLLKERTVDEDSPDGEEEKQEKDFGQKYNPYLIFLFSIGYAILIKIMGFFVATAIFSAVSMWFLGLRKITTFVLSIGGISVFIYILFVLQLKVPLPKGILF
ncbi:MAG TPA: tripartite tricarboxylate transporter TctB family protein [Clostridia bacterium]|nr:tripartite tricarboxylate transporter TctB family protein [Clostridia bacterium]